MIVNCIMSTKHDLCFQEFGIRQLSEHIIDPLVIIQIEEAVINCPRDKSLTGLLFGKQNLNNLTISAMFVTTIGKLSPSNEFIYSENFETFITYYEKVYNLSFVGLFAVKKDFDRESTVQISQSFKFKKTTDFVYLKVHFDTDNVEFSYELFTSVKNVLFQDYLIFSQSVPFKIDFENGQFLKGELKSEPGYILRGESRQPKRVRIKAEAKHC